jgi:hypothetical protein
VLTLLSAPTTTPPSYCTATMVVPVCGASAAAPDVPIAALLRLQHGYSPLSDEGAAAA